MDLEFDVIELPKSDHPNVGDTAPDFTRPLVNEEFWEDVSLSALVRKEPVLLVFYPMDGDFPATYIWNELRDRAWNERYGVEIIGLSISTPYEQKTLIRERTMDYRLFSDPGNGVAESYGIVNDLDGDGRNQRGSPCRVLARFRPRYRVRVGRKRVARLSRLRRSRGGYRGVLFRAIDFRPASRVG